MSDLYKRRWRRRICFKLGKRAILDRMHSRTGRHNRCKVRYQYEVGRTLEIVCAENQGEASDQPSSTSPSGGVITKSSQSMTVSQKIWYARAKQKARIHQGDRRFSGCVMPYKITSADVKYLKAFPKYGHRLPVS